MTSFIELTTTPFRYPIFFETTGIVVKATSKERDGPATVNGVPVVEKFNTIVFILQTK